jgi:hypothetical protein
MLLLMLLVVGSAKPQPSQKSSKKEVFIPEKYISFNPLSPAEPVFAMGPSFGNRFSPRSEYFTELAYVAKSPYYDYYDLGSLHGGRLIVQYRYHFLQRWQPLLKMIGMVNQERAARRNFFAGLEFRYKPYRFSSSRAFINEITHDTLQHFAYRAGAVSIGGAILFGGTLNLSKKRNWKLEITSGLGAKQKIIRYKNVPAGYIYLRSFAKDGPIIPAFDDEAGSPYIPFAFRLRYVIR